MKRLMLLLQVSAFCLNAVSQASSPFKMRSHSPSHSIQINQPCVSNNSIDLSGVVSPIEAFAITGSLIQNCDSSFVRILLEDVKGTDYIVLESNKRINNVDTLILDNYCQETQVLEDVVPVKLHVYIKNAQLIINSLEYNLHANTNNNSPLHIKTLHNASESVIKEQAWIISQNINAYNQANHYIWTADTTQMSFLPWSIKKIIYNMEDDTDLGGLEYYSGGVFEFPRKSSFMNRYDSIWNAQLASSSYVDSFDWRNRHGKNWITSVKNQGAGASCWAFSAIGTTEAMVNLYYNQKLDLDLSEQELVSCSRPDTYSYIKGGDEVQALNWIAFHGVIDEASFPFQYYSVPCSEKHEYFQECVSFIGVKTILGYSMHRPDSIKKYLISNGPLATSFKNGANAGHAVVLVGYGTIHEGLNVDTISGGYYQNSFMVDNNYPHIGETYWILKNSYAGTFPDYILMYTPPHILQWTSYIKTPIQCVNYSDDDIICSDNDGDGYYYWGIGPKPANCPSWVPDVPDGNDNDDTVGPMDDFGHLYNLTSHQNDTIFIDTDTVWDKKQFIYSHVVVRNGAHLTVKNDVTFYKDVTLSLLDHSQCTIAGGTLFNALIIIKELSGSKINIINNGGIQRRNATEFVVPLGSTFEMNYGNIN